MRFENKAFIICIVETIDLYLGESFRSIHLDLEHDCQTLQLTWNKNKIEDSGFLLASFDVVSNKQVVLMAQLEGGAAHTY